MAHRVVCPVPKCPEKTVARLATNNNDRRLDLCFRHAIVSLRDWEGDVEIVEVWNGVSVAQLEEATRQLRRFGNE